MLLALATAVCATYATSAEAATTTLLMLYAIMVYPAQCCQIVTSWNSIDSLFQCILRFFSLQFRLFWSHTAQHLLCIEQFTVQNLRFSLNLFVSIHSFLLLSLSLFAWILLIFFHSMFFSLSLYHTLSLTIIPSTILCFSENSKTFWKRSLVWMVDKIY